jgi:hypothetical protein
MNFKDNAHTKELVKMAQESESYVRLKPLDEDRRLAYAASVVTSMSKIAVTEAAIPPELAQV